MKSRAGYLLAEALCALALSALLAIAGATMLSGARHALANAETRSRAERAAIEALAVTAALARDADSIVLLGDTAVELTVRVADAVACARVGGWLILPPARTDGGATLAILSQSIEADDELRAFVRDSLTSFTAWLSSTVDSASTRTGPDGCSLAERFVAPGSATAARSYVASGDMDSRVVPGTPVRVGRRGRLALYSAGRGEWMLGWRRCARGACGVIQPLAGPLRSASAGGFVIRAAGGGVLDVAVRVPGLPDPYSSSVVRTDAGR